jgi:chromosome segregation ATPase
MKSTGTDALSRFKTLEERIERLLNALLTSRKEKTVAERDLAQARGQIRKLQNDIESMSEERTAVRNRVKGLISNIAEMEPQKEENIV